MRFVVDHDLHIHSHLSLCSKDPAQNKDNILAFGVKHGLKTLCLTDHMWDPAVPGAENFWFYAQQPYERSCQSLPLPQADGVRFLFGCETDQLADTTVGVSPAVMEKLDFIIIPTTHLHMNGFTLRGDESVEERAKLWCNRFEAVLDMDLPFHKIGIAHLTCALIDLKHYLEVLATIPKEEYHRLFAKAAKVGVGIELNFSDDELREENHDLVLTPYKIAKEEGCKFYLGSDAHNPAGLERAFANYEKIVTLLDLTEEDKIPFLR